MSLSFSQPNADLYVPDGAAMPDALARTTHLCIGAHQDDQEFMAYHGIAACFGNTDRWFTGVVVTDGGGSARCGPYAQFSDDDMKTVRRNEQHKAALVGEYACQIQLAYPSHMVKRTDIDALHRDLTAILEMAAPETVYLHNPADKHDTHVAVTVHALTALRALPVTCRPRHVYGCEIWRDLDWLPDMDKQILDVSAHPNLAAALSGVFDSQITGGKRYDLAVAGRRMAHATFHESHAVDASTALNWAMDLSPLVADAELDITTYTCAYIDRLREDVSQRIRKFERS